MKKKMHFTIMGLVAVLALALALTGFGKTADTTSSNQDQQENTATESTTIETNETNNQSDTSISEAETTPAQSSDGRYTYTIDGHELSLSVRLEDYIDGDILDWKGLRNALGYTEGKIRDSGGNVIAETGTPNKNTPIAELSFSMNLADREQTIVYYVTAESGSESQILMIESFNPPRNLTFNQLVVAVYLWDYYSDGEIHDDPLIEILADYRHELGSDRKIAYQIP